MIKNYLFKFISIALLVSMSLTFSACKETEGNESILQENVEDEIAGEEIIPDASLNNI